MDDSNNTPAPTAADNNEVTQPVATEPVVKKPTSLGMVRTMQQALAEQGNIENPETSVLGKKTEELLKQVKNEIYGGAVASGEIVLSKPARPITVRKPHVSKPTFQSVTRSPMPEIKEVSLQSEPEDHISQDVPVYTEHTSTHIAAGRETASEPISEREQSNYEDLLSEEKDVTLAEEQATIKRKSLTEELNALSSKLDQLERSRSELEVKEKSAEAEEHRLDELLKEALTDEKKHEIEEKRWQAEQNREQIEQERWEIDQAIVAQQTDITESKKHIEELEHELQRLAVKERSVRAQKQVFESKKQAGEIQDKIEELHTLKEQVLAKQQDITVEVKNIEARIKSVDEEDAAIVKEINDIEVAERAEKSPERRHQYEEQRWERERRRRGIHEERWKVKAELNKLEHSRSVWAERLSRFEDAEKELTRQLLVIKRNA